MSVSNVDVPFPVAAISEMRSSRSVSERILAAMEAFNELAAQQGSGSKAAQAKRYRRAVAQATGALIREPLAIRVDPNGNLYFDSGRNGTVANLAHDRVVTQLLRTPGVHDNLKQGIELIRAAAHCLAEPSNRQAAQQLLGQLSTILKSGLSADENSFGRYVLTEASSHFHVSEGIAKRIAAHTQQAVDEALGSEKALALIAKLLDRVPSSLHQFLRTDLPALQPQNNELAHALAGELSPVVPPVSATLANDSVADA